MTTRVGPVGKEPRQQRHRDVVDRHVFLGVPFGTAAMRVPVKDHRHRESADRILETARADERVDLRRFAFDGFLNGRVVEQDDLDARSCSRASDASSLSASLTASWTNCLMTPFAPRSQRALAESAGKAFHPGDADAADFGRLSVENRDAGVGEDGA